MSKTEDIIEEIKKSSKFNYFPGISIVDKLSTERWCKDDDLIMAYEEIEPEDNRVIVFFQMSGRINLPDQWISLKTLSGFPKIRFRKINERDRDQGFLTQVLISFQLSQRKRELYPLYLHGLNNKEDKVKTKLRSKGFLKISEFEILLTEELQVEILAMFSRILSIYKVSCNDVSLKIPEKLYKIFFMVNKGRVVRQSDLPKITKESSIVKEDKKKENKNLENLHNFLNSRRPLSVYEKYLLETSKLVETQFTNLSVVQTVMILDWFTNEIIENRMLPKLAESLKNDLLLYDLISNRAWENDDDKKLRVRTEDKFGKYFPAIGIDLPNHIYSKLKSLIKKRDAIVHREQVEQVSLQMANTAVETGYHVVSYCMDALLDHKIIPINKTSKE